MLHVVCNVQRTLATTLLDIAKPHFPIHKILTSNITYNRCDNDSEELGVDTPFNFFFFCALYILVFEAANNNSRSVHPTKAYC